MASFDRKRKNLILRLRLDCFKVFFIEYSAFFLQLQKLKFSYILHSPMRYFTRFFFSSDSKCTAFMLHILQLTSILWSPASIVEQSSLAVDLKSTFPGRPDFICLSGHSQLTCYIILSIHKCTHF